jgi:hypothetical protein
MSNYTVAHDETTPLGTESKSYGDNRIRELKVSIRERLATEHDDITGSSGDALLRHKGGECTVMLVGTTAEIAAVTPSATSASECPIAYDTDLKCNKYWNGTAWQIATLSWDNVWNDPVHSHTTDAEGGLTAVPGSITQVVNTQTGAVATGTTLIPWDDTIPQNDEGTEFMTLAITPKSVSNILLIDVAFQYSAAAGYRCSVALFQDTTANALAASSQYGGLSGYYDEGVAYLRHKMTAGTIASTTFKVRAGPNLASTITFNGQDGSRYFGGVMASSITITEIVV